MSDYSVRIEPQGRTLKVGSQQPVLEAALAAGLNLPHSCKSGHCGSCRIARLRPLAPDVMQLWLRLPSVERLPFRAGQYLDVLLEGGRRRSFSIASPPHDCELLELHARRVSGGGFTERLFGATQGGAAALEEGSLLRIEGPLGQFSYREGLGPLIMVAGGTGFAPLKSMLRHVLENGIRRAVHFYWGARHTHDLYEEALLLEWARRYPQLSFTAVLSQATSLEATHHRVGWVHEAVLADHPRLAGLEVYAAGPPAMIEAMRASFPQHGLAPERLYFDSFDYAPDVARR